jgi:hypothetical protein
MAWSGYVGGGGLEPGAAGAVGELEAFDGFDLAADAGGVLERSEVEGNRRDVPYQPLIKMWPAEKVG